MKKELNTKERDQLIITLEKRFEKFAKRHSGIKWSVVLERLLKQPAQLFALHQMEVSGGEPDVVDQDKKSGAFLFYDCSAESPAGRRSSCYDEAALHSRKENKPKHSAMGFAEEMGVELLTEADYRHLQTLGEFDLKTSSWVFTPEAIRKLGGAVFCDSRYNTVFVYHNGAESYYAARGFRAKLWV